MYLPWLILQSVIGWAFVALEWKWTAERDSMFDSWLVKRFPVDVSDYLTECCTRVVQLLSTWIAYGVFAWRYHNVPQNWKFVGTSLANKVASYSCLARCVSGNLCIQGLAVLDARSRCRIIQGPRCRRERTEQVTLAKGCDFLDLWTVRHIS